jgi:hypothetical protein
VSLRKGLNNLCRLPLDLGDFVERSTSTTDLALDLPKEKIAEVPPTIGVVSPSIQSNVKEEQAKQTIPLTPTPMETRNEGIQHSIRNVSIQHGHEETLSISDSDSIVITHPVEQSKRVTFEEKPGARTKGKTMEQRLAEWIQQEVLLRVVQAPIGQPSNPRADRATETSPEQVKAPPMAITTYMDSQATQTLELEQEQATPLMVERKETSMQTIRRIETDFDDPSSIIIISDTSPSISLTHSSIHSPSGSSSYLAPATPSPKKFVILQEEIEELIDEIILSTIRTELIECVYECFLDSKYATPVGTAPPVPVESKDVESKREKHVLEQSIQTDLVTEISAKKEEVDAQEEWSHQHNLSAEESLLMDVQKLKQEAMDQLEAERQRVAEMEKEKQRLEEELGRWKRIEKEQQEQKEVSPGPALSPASPNIVANDVSIPPIPQDSSESREDYPSVDAEDSGYTPSYSSMIDPTIRTNTKERDDTLSMTISSLPTLSEGELLFR